ncbi:hypothetical protein ACQ4PT_061269 [Festuca glaucescens]
MSPAIRQILHTFGAASGLHVNCAKSAAALVAVEAVSLAFACPHMQFPCSYISLPLSLGRLHKRDLQYVLDKLAGKLALWKAKLLSKEGRITYVQAIMTGFAIYHLLALDLELWFLQAVDKLHRGFLWVGSHEARGRQCCVAWHLKSDEHWPWAGLPLHSKPDDVALFNASVCVSVGDGLRILFWADPWIGGLTVTALARAVVALVKPKLRNSRSIKDGLAGDPWVLDIAGSLSVDAIVQYLKLWAAVRDVALDVGSDTFRWKWTSKGSFTARSAYLAMSEVLPDKQKDPNIVTVTSKTQKPDLTCKVCGITSTSQKAMQDHLEGKAHKRKVSKLPQPMPALKLPSKANVPKDASILWAAESDKKQNLNFSCTLCGIPLTSEKAMEDHLKGKSHRKKAMALVREATEHVQEEKEEKCSFTPTKKTMMTKDGMIHDVMQIDEKEEEASFTPTKKIMMTKDGTIHDVMQMNGYVFCEVCNVRTAHIVTMMCHLQGIKHISKEARKPPAETVTIATSVANGDPQMVAMRINGVPHNVRRVGGSLLCELCDVKVPEALQGVMQSHLSGKIHTKKLKAMAAAVDKGAVGKAEVITKDVALATNFHITETPGQEEMMDDGADSIGGSELVEAKSKEASLVPGEPAVGACVPESMAPYGGATVGCPTAKVGENEADAEGNSSRMQEMEAVKTNGIVVVPADQDEVKYQVEGKEFIVLRQPDGRLSCRLCDVHGCAKYDMIKHLYTHLGNAHLADKRSR